MAKVEGYWSKHHWGAIQGITGTGCLVWGVWAYYNPYDPSPLESGGVAMHPFPLSTLIVLCLVCASVAIPGVVNALGYFLRPKRYPNTSEQEIERLARELEYANRRLSVPEWESYGSPEAMQKAVASQNALNELGRSVEGLLTSLQIETLRLRFDLLAFQREVGPFPAPPESGTKHADRIGDQKSQQEMLDKIVVWSEKYATWARKLMYGYREKFAPRVLKLMNSAGSLTGVVVVGLEPYTQFVHPGDDFDQLILLLEQLVWRIDSGPKDHVVQRIWKMIDDLTGDEYVEAIRNPAFADLVNKMPPKVKP